MSNSTKKNKKKCSYCGNEYTVEDMMKKGVLVFKGSTIDENGQPVRICSNCIKACNEIYQANINKITAKNGVDITLMTPSKIKSHLDEWVLDQERAKTAISTEVYNQFKRLKRIAENPKANEELRIEKSNMILIGPTGVGKTELVRSLSALLDLPYTIQDATSFTSAGYIGRDVDEILKDLYNAAGKNIEKAQKGIVFLDEFDKLRKSSTRTGQKDVGGESVQQALLKIIEGGEFDVKKDKMGSSTFKFDTSNVLFILGGAFVGIDEIVSKRLKTNKNAPAGIGFGGEPQSKAPVDYNSIAEDICQEDLKEFGIIPEVLGRCPVITTFNELSEETLVRILTEPKHAIVKQYKELFSMDNVDLEFTEEALKAIAKKAKERKIGARALRSELQEILKDAMFEVPDMDNVNKVLVVVDDDNKIVCQYEHIMSEEL